MKQEQLEHLYSKYRDWLLRLAYNIVGDWQLAADVVHDVFTKTLSKKIDIEDIHSPNYWLAKSVINALDYKRQAWYRIRTYLRDWDSIFKTNPDNSHETDSIQLALKKLTPRERAVLVLRDVEGYAVSEIAKMMDIKDSTVRVLSKTGREKFKYHYLKE